MRFGGILLAFMLLAIAPAVAQVQQSGAVTPGHAPVWATDNVLSDAGTSTSGAFSSLGVLSNGSCGFGDISAAITGAHYLTCLGNGDITFSAFGGATAAQFSFTINGVNSMSFGADGSVSFANAPSITFPAGSVPNVVSTGGGSFSGLKIINDNSTPNTKVDMTATSVVMANATNGIVSDSSFSCNIDYATTGAGGLDTGSLVASTWYYDYAINNGTTTSCLGSTSATAPSLPSGYTYKVRLGAELTDASSHFMRVEQLGRIAQYVVTAASNTANLPQMGTGTTGSVTVPTWVAVSVGSFVPPTASRIFAAVQVSNGIVMVAPNNSYGAAASTSNPPPVVDNSANAPVLPFSMLLESTSIYWASSVSGGALWCRGWEDNL